MQRSNVIQIIGLADEIKINPRGGGEHCLPGDFGPDCAAGCLLRRPGFGGANAKKANLGEGS
jgi:hypothetical protein